MAQITSNLAQQPTTSANIRLPNLILPKFTGAEPLDRFFYQLRNVLETSKIPARLWLSYLKQKCLQDARACDILCSQESGENVPTPDAAESAHIQYFETIIAVLESQCGVPKDQGIQNLLSAYYALQQNPTETVADFAHRFTETKHALEKLVLGIHRPVPGNDIELLHAFALKLRPEISKDILSRDFTFSSISYISIQL